MSTRYDDQLLMLLDGDATPGALALLRDDPAARRRYLDLVALQIMLHEQLEDGQRDWGVQNKATVRSALRVPSLFAAVAAIIALAITAGFFLPSAEPRILNSAHPVATQSVGILSDIYPDAVFADASTPRQSGVNLMPGPIRLTAGRAQIMFNSTAVVDLTGPCEFEMTGPNRGRLVAGRLEAYVRPEARGFTVDLPHGSKVVDLGTRFLVEVDVDAASHVTVLAGRVRMVDKHENSIQLGVAQTCVIDSTGQITPYTTQHVGLDDLSEPMTQTAGDTLPRLLVVWTAPVQKPGRWTAVRAGEDADEQPEPSAAVVLRPLGAGDYQVFARVDLPRDETGWSNLDHGVCRAGLTGGGIAIEPGDLLGVYLPERGPFAYRHKNNLQANTPGAPAGFRYQKLDADLNVGDQLKLSLSGHSRDYALAFDCEFPTTTSAPHPKGDSP